MSSAVIDKFNPLPVLVVNDRKVFRDEIYNNSLPHSFQLNGDDYRSAVVTTRIITTDTNTFDCWITTASGLGVTERVTITPIPNVSAYSARFVFNLAPSYNSLSLWIEGIDMMQTSVSTLIIATSDLVI